MKTAEQKARDMLERVGVEDAQSLTAGDVIEIANLIADNSRLRSQLEQVTAERDFYRRQFPQAAKHYAAALKGGKG